MQLVTQQVPYRQDHPAFGIYAMWYSIFILITIKHVKIGAELVLMQARKTVIVSAGIGGIERIQTVVNHPGVWHAVAIIIGVTWKRRTALHPAVAQY